MIVGKVETKLRFKMTKLLYAEFSITGGMISNDTLVGIKVYSYGLPNRLLIDSIIRFIYDDESYDMTEFHNPNFKQSPYELGKNCQEY